MSNIGGICLRCIFLIFVFVLFWFFKTIITFSFRINWVINWSATTTLKLFLQPFISMFFLYKLRTFSSLILKLNFKIWFSNGRSWCFLLSDLLSSFDLIKLLFKSYVFLLQKICLFVFSLFFCINFRRWLWRRELC